LPVDRLLLFPTYSSEVVSCCVQGGHLIGGWKPGTYLALILIWPAAVMLQIGFGDIRGAGRRLSFTATCHPYLSLADTLAIGLD
jgi:hypothetical protein